MALILRRSTFMGTVVAAVSLMVFTPSPQKDAQAGPPFRVLNGGHYGGYSYSPVYNGYSGYGYGPYGYGSPTGYSYPSYDGYGYGASTNSLFKNSYGRSRLFGQPNPNAYNSYGYGAYGSYGYGSYGPYGY